MNRREARLRRQIEALARHTPLSPDTLHRMGNPRYRYVRIPASLILILGGLASFLPVLGLWMLPLGLVLLSIDVPALQPCVSAAIIRVRRRVDLWLQRRRRRRRERAER